MNRKAYGKQLVEEGAEMLVSQFEEDMANKGKEFTSLQWTFGKITISIIKVKTP